MARKRSASQQLLLHGPAALERLVDDLDRVQSEIWHLGRDLVLAGTSYAALGRMLGVTPQAARQRFARHVQAWRDEHGDLMPWDFQESWEGVDEWAIDQAAAMHRALTETTELAL